MRQYSSSQGRRTLPETRIFVAPAELWIFPAIRYMARPVPLAGSANPSILLFLARFPFFQTNNLQINGHNYLWPPQLRTTAIKLINRGRLSVSPDCCVIRGAINKAVLLPCDILQMVWQQLLLLQPHGSIYPHHGWVRHRYWRKTHFLRFPLFRFASFRQCVGSRTKFALPRLLCVCPPLHCCYPTLASYRKHSSN